MVRRSLIVLLMVVGWWLNGYGQRRVVVHLDKDRVVLPEYSGTIVTEVVRATVDPSVDVVSPVRISGTNFFGASFQQEAAFSSATFLDAAWFNNAAFQDDADFFTTTFQQEAIFSADTFQQLADFSINTYWKEVNFSDADFLKIADFSNDTFRQSLKFRGTTFNQGANFWGTIFKGTVDFSFVHFLDSSWSNFEKAQLPDTICFSHVHSDKNEIDLLNIRFDSTRFGKQGSRRPYNIILYKSDLSKFYLDYAYFHLLTKDQDGNELTRDEAMALYEALLKNFNDRGQKMSAEKLDVEYQRYKWCTNPSFTFIALGKEWHAGSLVGLIPDWWWKFGYEKQRVFGWTLGLLFLFMLLTLPMLPFLQREVYPLEALTKKEAVPNSQPYKGWRRLWYSFVYTGTLFFRLTLKAENIKFDSKRRHIAGTMYVLFVYVIGVVCLAYMANFVLQK